MASEKSLPSRLILSRHHGPGGRRCACPLRVASGAPSKPHAIWDSWKTWLVRQEPGMAPRPPTPCGHVLMPGSLERSQNRVGTGPRLPGRKGCDSAAARLPGPSECFAPPPPGPCAWPLLLPRVRAEGARASPSCSRASGQPRATPPPPASAARRHPGDPRADGPRGTVPPGSDSLLTLQPVRHYKTCSLVASVPFTSLSDCEFASLPSS